MANAIPRGHGRWAIQYRNANGDRKTFKLGRVSKKQAESVKPKIEALVAAAITGHPPDDEVSKWIKTRDDVMLKELAEHGLIPKQVVATVGGFLEDYVSKRIDVKPATSEVWGQVTRNLREFFGADRPLRAVNAGDAEDFKLYLKSQGLAATTVAKRLQFARQFFRAALRHKLISENPFADVRENAGASQSRQRFITQADAAKLLEACPDLDWRLIVALSRFGGLRCPSEVLSLRWQDIDWATGRVTVTSPKTEHHPGKDTRVIPLFPELRPVLEEAYFDPAREGSVYVVNEKYRRGAMGPRGWRGCNLRTTMEKIIRRAGLSPWPRLFHNMRSSRETELTERFPVHVVTAWLGNTPEIARKHYLQVTDQHFQQACSALQPALQQQPATSIDEPQQPKQQQAASGGGVELNAACSRDLRPVATPRAAHLSPCQITRNGEDRTLGNRFSFPHRRAGERALLGA